MEEYLVEWRIDVLATSPDEAARQAFELMRDPHSVATVLHVTGPDGVEQLIDVGGRHE